jgi:hypothetical protein
MPDYTGNTFEDINPQYPEDTELAGYHAAAMRQVKRFLKQPEGLESIISEWINSDSDNSIKDALNKLIRIPGVGELYFTMDNNFNPNNEDNQLYFSGTWEKIEGKLLVSTGTISAYTPNETAVPSSEYAINANRQGTTDPIFQSGLDGTNPEWRWFNFVANDNPGWFHYNNCYTAIKIPHADLSSANLVYNFILNELNLSNAKHIPVRISFSNNGIVGVNAGTELAKVDVGPQSNVSGLPYTISGSAAVNFIEGRDAWLIATYNCDNISTWLTNSKGGGSNMIKAAMKAKYTANFTSSYEVVADAIYQESVPFIGVNIWVKTSDDNPNSDDLI